MADGVEIGKGTVTVGADLSAFDAAMASLPKKAAAKMDAAMKALQSRMTQVKLDLRVAYNAGDLEAQKKLLPIYDNLKAKIASVEAATIKQGQAARQAANEAKAASAAALAQKAAERAAAQQARQDARDQLADQRRVAQQYAQAERARLGGGGKAGAAGSGGMGGAMGLMVLSQSIDDMQYGFKAIVNNIPQMGMALGSMFGMSTEAAMKFGAVAGIAGVAINYLVNHAGEWATSLGFFAQETKKSSDALEALRDRIKELEDKPIKLAIDTFEIDQAKKKLEELEAAARAFKRMGETSSPGEKASGEAISQKFSELGVAKGDQIQGDLKAKMAQELLGQSETVKEADREAARAAEVQRKAELRLQHSGSMGGQRQALDDIETAKARVKVAQEAAAKARLAITKEGGEAEREIGKIWADATKGNVDAQKKLVARLKAVGQNALAGSIESLRPDLMEPLKEDPDIARTNAFNEAITAKAREARAAEDSRLAGAMAGSVGQKYLQSPTMSDETLRAEVKKSMEKAGMSAKEIGDAMVGTAKKLRENLDKAVKDRSLDRGIDEGVARQQLLKEARDRDDKQAGLPKSEVMSTGAYLNKLLVASLSKPDPAANKALVAQEDTAKATMKFADLAEKWESRGIKVIGKDNPARVAPGR